MAVLSFVQINDATDALMARSEVWTKLAEVFAGRAIKAARDGYDPQKALEWASAAEGCIWQATGDSDAIDLKDVKR
jgi:hypothetical protein